MRKEEAEFLIACKGENMTDEEIREVGKWWRRRLRSTLSRAEVTIAVTTSLLRGQGKADANESTRQVVAVMRATRSQVIETATLLATAERYAEFRADFEDIAARAEALPI
jgi:hypothetical protein